MDPIMIPPNLAYSVPVLIAEVIMTLKSARFLLSVFRAFTAKTIVLNGVPVRQDTKAIRQQRAYAHAETLMEVRVMVMLALVGVLGVQWSLDVQTGRTVFLIESVVATIVQLFLHLLWSLAAIFFPETVTNLLIDCSSSPVTAKSAITFLFLIMDLFSHVANDAFMAAVVRTKAIAVVSFLFAVLLYRVLDKGLLALGETIHVKIQQELRELEPNTDNIQAGEVNGDAATSSADGVGGKSKSKKKTSSKKKGH